MFYFTWTHNVVNTKSRLSKLTKHFCHPLLEIQIRLNLRGSNIGSLRHNSAFQDSWMVMQQLIHRGRLLVIWPQESCVIILSEPLRLMDVKDSSTINYYLGKVGLNLTFMKKDPPWFMFGLFNKTLQCLRDQFKKLQINVKLSSSGNFPRLLLLASQRTALWFQCRL